jgi:hypothetical protein
MMVYRLKDHLTLATTLIIGYWKIVINKNKIMIVYDSPKEIALFRMKSLRGALKLEILGMKRRGRSVYSIVKEEFGFKGSKKKVLEQLEKALTKEQG